MSASTQRAPRATSYRLAILFALSTALVAGCGGGGGGGGGGGPPAPAASVTISPTSLSFAAFANDAGSEVRNVTISWTGANVAGYAVGTLAGVPALPGWVAVTAAQVTANPSTIAVRRTSTLGLAPGRYTTTLRIVTGDTNLNPISQVDLPISLDVLPAPTVAPANLSMSWVESEQPASRQLTVTRDSGAQFVSASATASWLTVSATGDTLTVSATPNASSVPPGTVMASVLVTYSASGGAQKTVEVPVAATVTRALAAPAQLAYEVNASTQLIDLLGRTATITTATQAAVQFSAATNAAWINANGASMSTGATNNLALQLQGAAISQLANGLHTATLTLTPSTPNIAPLQIPVTLDLRLPEVHFVAPVAFTDTDTSDYVIIRGDGLDDPNIDLRIDGVPAAGATIVNDTEIRLVPGDRAAGNYAVTVSNLLGFTRDSGTLRVADPPAYVDDSLDAAIGLVGRVVSSPISNAVFVHQCYFCSAPPTGPFSTIHKFTFAAGAWTRTEHAYNLLVDFALSPDESVLLVLVGGGLVDGQLLLVDPVSMTTVDTYAVPSFAGGLSRQLAVANDGLVFISDSPRAFSLRSRTFVYPPGGYEVGRGPIASRDGSRVLFAFNGENRDVPFKFYEAATGRIATLAPAGRDPLASYDRHATTAFATSDSARGQVLGSNFVVRGTLAVWSGEISPDGARLYTPDFDVGGARVFDISGAIFVESTAITIPDAANKPARLGLDPSGRALFYVMENKFVVRALP